MAGKLETFFKKVNHEDSSMFFLEKALDKFDKSALKSIIADEIDFLIGCQDSKYPDIWELSQKLVLKVMSDWNKKDLAKNLKFLVNCQRGNREIKEKSERLAMRIDKEDLFKEIEFLVESYQSDTGISIQNLSENLVRKITPENLFKKIEYLVNRQKFDADNIFRNISARLVEKIVPKNLLKKIEFLVQCLLSKHSDIRKLSQNLILKINRKNLRGRLKCLIDGKKLGEHEIASIKKILDLDEAPEREIEKIRSFLTSK